MIVIDRCGLCWNDNFFLIETKSKLRNWNLWKDHWREDIFHNENFTSINIHFTFLLGCPFNFRRDIYLWISVVYTVFTQLDNNNRSGVWNLYFTTHALRSNLLFLHLLQRHGFLSTKLLIQGFIQNRLIISFKQLFRKISTPWWKVLCHLHRDGDWMTIKTFIYFICFAKFTNISW